MVKPIHWKKKAEAFERKMKRIHEKKMALFDKGSGSGWGWLDRYDRLTFKHTKAQRRSFRFWERRNRLRRYRGLSGPRVPKFILGRPLDIWGRGWAGDI